MLKRTASGIMLTLLLIFMLTFAFHVQSAEVESKTTLPESYTTMRDVTETTGQTVQLVLETDKYVYVLGENVTIILKNVGTETVEIGGYPAWQIFTYPKEEPVYPEVFAFLAWSLDPGENDTFVWNQYNEFNQSFVKPGTYVIKDTQGWGLSAYFKIIEAKAVILNTEAIGVVPNVYGDIIVFFTDEKLAQEDLNGDGDVDDLIIRYYNVSACILTNTKASGHYPAIYENTITFTGRTVRYYNITEGSTVDASVLAYVDIPSIYGNIIAFPTYEQVAGIDLNGDGDTDDSVIRYFDLSTGTLVNTGVVGWGASIYGDIIAFSTFEYQMAQDLNGDGDTQDSVIRYYNISSGVVVNTGAEGWWPTLYMEIIVFESHYVTYTAITYYNISDGTLVDTKIDGRMASVYGNIIAFATPEADYGVGDLNGDGDSVDWVVRYYNISTEALINTGAEGVRPSVYENLIAFETYEEDAGIDLNNDGDTTDSIIQYILLTTPKIIGTFEACPRVLNLQSKGKWITAFIELPEGYDVDDIKVTTILLNDTVPAELRLVAIGDYDEDGIPDLMVKFDRAQVASYILDNIDMEERFMTITLTITGYLNDDTMFQGSDTIRIILCMPRGIGRHIFPI